MQGRKTPSTWPLARTPTKLMLGRFTNVKHREFLSETSPTLIFWPRPGWLSKVSKQFLLRKLTLFYRPLGWYVSSC